MKSFARLLLLSALCVGFLHLSTAQMGMAGPPVIAGVFSPELGAGAEYAIERQGDQKKTFTIAVIGKEGPGYWIEYGGETPHGTIYMKTLTARDGDNVTVRRSIFQMPGRPPMEMSSMMSAHRMQSEESKADMRANAESLGKESITTPAGTFSCEHWRSKKDGSEYWLSDRVSPWKLVKMKGKEQTLTLTKVITDAKTHITGTPVSMEEMMKQHMGNMDQSHHP